MLAGNPFYHGTIRRAAIVFGSLFNDIYVQRFNSDESVKQTIKVPLAYGPSEKWLARINQDSSIDDGKPDVQMQLPRISYEFNSVVYDSSRKLPLDTRNRFCGIDDDGNEVSTILKTPFNIEFQLSIMTKFVDDGLQIIEQILPYFKPDYIVRIKDSSEFDTTSDIIYTLDSVSNEDTYESGYNELRSIVWTLTFTAKTYLYGPVYGGDTASDGNSPDDGNGGGLSPNSTLRGLIKHADVIMYCDPCLDEKLEKYSYDVVPETAGPEDEYEIEETLITYDTDSKANTSPPE